MLMVLSLHYASAQCKNSPEFVKSLEYYKNFEAHDSFYLNYEVPSLTSKMWVVHSALTTLRSVKNHEDYATLLSEIHLKTNLPEEVTISYYADMDSTAFVFKDKDYKLIKTLNNLYHEYLEELSKNKFTMEALNFITDQVKQVSIVANEQFEVYPKIALRKPIDQYTNYEIYILTFFYAIKEAGDISSLVDDEKSFKAAIEQLKQSNCPLYSELGKEFQLELGK